MARYWLGQHAVAERSTGSALFNVPYRVENVDGTAALTVYDDDVGGSPISSTGTTNLFGEPEGWVDPNSGRIRFYPDSENEKIEYFVAPGSGGGGGSGYSEVTTKGDLLAGTGSAAVARVGVPAGGTNRSIPVTDSTQTSGVRWSVKAAPYNLLDLATGDGSTDDTSAVNTVISAAAGANRPVIAPAATYVTESAFLCPSNTTVIGDGPGKTIWKAADGHDANMFVKNTDYTNGNSNITLQGIEFNGNKANRTYSEPQAAAVEFRGNTSHGSVARRILIRDCYLHDSLGLGIAFQGTYESAVIGCVVKDNYRDGITFSRGCRYNRIVGNHVIGCGDDHIAYHSGATTAENSSDVAIVGNTCGTGLPDGANSYAAGGITLSGVHNATISGNTVRGGEGWGIKCYNNNLNSIRGVAIIGNSLRDIGSGTTPSGSGNAIQFEVSGTGGYGGSGSETQREITIVGNTIVNPRNHGIHFLGLASFELQMVQVANNVLIGGGASGAIAAAHGIYIQQYVRTSRFANNTIRDFSGNGINVGTTGTLSWLDFNGNTIFNNNQQTAGSGINLGAATNFSVANNRVFDTASSKTQVYALNYATATNGLIMGNDFRGNLTGSSTGTKGSGVYQHMNIGAAGTLLIGDAGVAGNI